MIFDYLIDFKYLASSLKSPEPGDPVLENFKKIVDACGRPEENGRLVLDSDHKILKDLSAIEVPASRYGKRLEYIVDECFLRRIPAGRFERRRMVGLNREDELKICVRDIPVFENNVSRIMKSLMSVDPAPDAVITNSEEVCGLVGVDLSADEVFDAVDAVRGRLKLEHTITLSEEHSGDSIQYLWSLLHTFGAAEESGFCIYDPYSFDDNNSEKRESLLRWVLHLLGATNPQRQNITVRVFSRCGRNDYVGGAPEGLKLQLSRLKRRLVEEEMLSHLNAVALELDFLFAVDDDEDGVIRRFKKDMQHDRYIRSSTHYFGIGSGIDSIGKRGAFNIQYKGRVGEGLTTPQLDELAMYYEDQANVENGRIREFICRI